MKRRTPEVARAAALATLLSGLGACAETEGGTPVASGGDPVDDAVAELGVPIPGCDSTSAPTGAGLISNVLKMNVDTAPLVLSAPSGTYAANGIVCVDSLGKPLKTTDVTSILISGSAADNKVIFDFLPGTYGTKIFASGGGITVDFNTTPGTGTDTVMFRATSLAETYKFGVGPAVSGAYPDVYAEITGDKLADIYIKPSSTGKFGITASMGGGNDTVTGAAVSPTDMDHFAGVTSTTITVAALPAAYGLTAYGGAGDDKFTGGFGDDAFYGGDGADTFKMNATSDGADIYSGDKDIDTVDYSNRSGDQMIDLGPQFPSVESKADLRSPLLWGATGTLHGKTLAFVIDGVRFEKVLTDSSDATFPSAPGKLIDALNLTINTAFSPGPPVATAKYAWLTAKNHLVISSRGNLVTSFVKIENDPALASGSAADTVLGLTADSSATPTALTMIDGNVDLTGLTYGGSGTLNGTRLALLVNGVAVVTSFVSPTDAANVVSLINSDINNALGTSSVVYAALITGNFLELKSTNVKFVVKSGVGPWTFSSAAQALGMTSYLEGNVDMSVAGVYTALTTATATLGVAIDGRRLEVSVSAQADATALLTTVNTAANTLMGTMGVLYASISPAHHLIISSATDVANSSFIKFEPDPAIIAGGSTFTAADAVLGLATSGASSKGAKVTGGDISVTTLYPASGGLTGTLAGTRLILVINGEYVEVDFTTAPTDATALLAAINTAANTALGTVGAVYATEDSMTNDLVLSGLYVVVKDGAAAETYTSAASILGLVPAAGIVRTVADADDGLALEHDDVRYSTENITSGDGNDVLIGNELKNTIKGNGGNDVISGGGSATCTLADGDTLQGNAGDDTFLMAASDCKATLTGGDGNNTVDFSGRTNSVTIKNNGTADDGETNEAVNVGTDIKHMIGGFGDDFITGGSSDETFEGGPGADTMTGGTGNDTVDYTRSPAAVNVTLCFATMVSACQSGTPGNDGMTGEHDQVYQIEHLIGSPFNDTLGALAGTTVGMTIEGGAGDDMITGGLGNDTLWGDDGDDTLLGSDGDDNLSGDNGNDVLDGGGNGDICIGDSSDLTAKVGCQL
jgi:Ca2+-binding RTX toxin-like protein